jgi:peptidoglycan/xylan/chitin deacetylase (PgdA/CDA1 family)
MKPRLKAWLGAGLLRSGVFRRVTTRQAVIVALHRVNDRTAWDALTIGVRQFDAFCDLFRRHFDVVPLAEIIHRVRTRAPLAGALAITFDDGYLDNFEEARPILLRHGLPATFFVSTNFIGTDTVPWWDQGIQPPLPWMRWEHVSQLQGDGFDIGGHTRTHADLGQVQGDEAWEEIAGGRAELARRLGQAPAHFAFPYGRPENLLEENRRLVQEAGFTCCVSCHGGTVRYPADPFRLQRVPISAWFATPQQLALEVAAGHA